MTTLLPMAAERAYVTGMSPLMTADELLQTNIPNKRTELVRGRLIVREPAGYNHGRVTMNLTVRLGAYVDSAGSGQLVAAETGFTLRRGPDTVREVLSPDDRPGETLAKVADWIDAGTRLIWVVDAQRRIVRVYRQDGTESIVAESDSLNGEAVLPGFTC